MHSSSTGSAAGQAPEGLDPLDYIYGHKFSTGVKAKRVKFFHSSGQTNSFLSKPNLPKPT